MLFFSVMIISWNMDCRYFKTKTAPYDNVSFKVLKTKTKKLYPTTVMIMQY